MKIKQGEPSGRQRTRTREVVGEQAPPGLLFDPERDITAADVAVLLEEVRLARASFAQAHVGDQACPLSLLAYGQEEKRLVLSEEELAYQEKNLKAYDEKVASLELSIFPTAITRFATVELPERKAQLKLDSLRNKLVKKMDSGIWEEKERVLGIAKTAFELRLLFPNMPLELPLDFFEQIRQEVEKRRNQFDLGDNAPMELVIYFKLLYPDHDLGMEEVVDELVVKQLRVVKDSRKLKDHYKQFGQQLVLLLLLTAGEIYVTSGGELRITKPKARIGSQSKKLPARDLT